MQQIIFGTSVLDNQPAPVTFSALRFPGKLLNGNCGFGVDETIFARHLLLLGGSGCGKTNVFRFALRQLRQAMTAADTAIIFDTKGEFFQEFARSDDYVLGNSEKFRPLSHSWNLFDELLADGEDNEQQILMNARELSAALFHGRGSESQPFFCNAARDLFRAVLLHFIRQARENPQVWKSRLNNRSLLRALQSYQAEDYIRILRHYPDLTYMLTYVGDGSSHQALGVFGELNSMLSEYFVGILADHRPGKSISMRQAVRERSGKAIFVEYDLSMGETLTPIYRLLVDQALKEALGRGNTKGNVYLIADEFKLLPKLEHIDDALNFGRGLGVRVMAGIQSIDQLYDIYGQDRGNVLAGGFGSLFAFHTNDASSREYITRRFGPNRVAYSYTNLQKNTVVSNERDGNTVEEWDQLRLGVGQAVIGLGDNEPFLFHFSEYGKEEAWL